MGLILGRYRVYHKIGLECEVGIGTGRRQSGEFLDWHGVGFLLVEVGYVDYSSAGWEPAGRSLAGTVPGPVSS